MQTYVEDISSTLSNLSQNKIENSTDTTDNLTIDNTGKLSFSNSGTEKLSVSTTGDLNLSGYITTSSGSISAASMTTTGTLTAGSMTSNGTIDAGSNAITTTGTMSAGTLNVTGNITGTLATATQPNITSVGTLSSLSVINNTTFGGTLTFDHTNSTTLGIIEWNLALNSSHRIYNRGNGNGSDGIPEGLIFGNSYNGDQIKFDRFGNVGIGTMNPGSALDVSGTANVSSDLTVGGDTNLNGILDVNGDANITGNCIIDPYENLDNEQGFDLNGTTSEMLDLDIVPLNIGETSSTDSYQRVASFYKDGATGNNNVGGWNISLFAQGTIICGSEVHIYSDQRIKNNIIDISDGEALQVLRQIKPKVYNYVDTLRKSSTPVYGFIAQEVKEVIPDSVETKKEFIPNVYDFGLLNDKNDTILVFENAVDISLNLCDGKCAYIKLVSHSNNLTYVNVVEKISDFQVRIQDPISDDYLYYDASINKYKIFVYGQLVNDFNTLKKSAIWTVTTAAVQEIDRNVVSNTEKITILEQENAEIKQENEKMKLTLNSVLQRLNALEGV